MPADPPPPPEGFDPLAPGLAAPATIDSEEQVWWEHPLVWVGAGVAVVNAVSVTAALVLGPRTTTVEADFPDFGDNVVAIRALSVSR